MGQIIGETGVGEMGVNRLNDVTVSMSSLLVVLRVVTAWFSIFNTVHLTDLGSLTEYRALTSLKMSSNLLIHHVGT